MQKIIQIKIIKIWVALYKTIIYLKNLNNMCYIINNIINNNKAKIMKISGVMQKMKIFRILVTFQILFKVKMYPLIIKIMTFGIKISIIMNKKLRNNISNMEIKNKMKMRY